MQNFIVAKFGGEALADTRRIFNIANIIKNHVENNEKPIVIVSAMLGVTDQLFSYINDISQKDSKNLRECDVVLSAGEQITAGLLALALTELGVKAQSFCAWQVPILTDSNYSYANISNICMKELKKCAKDNIVPIVTGFQGIDETGSITTLGRGGSDITAITISKFMAIKKCFFYKDVDGVYAQDPKLFLNIKKHKELTYDEMLELSLLGAKILHHKAVQLAKENNIEIHVKSFLEEKEGTVIS